MSIDISQIIPQFDARYHFVCTLDLSVSRVLYDSLPQMLVVHSYLGLVPEERLLSKTLEQHHHHHLLAAFLHTMSIPAEKKKKW